jgi:iron complex outermembrane receptor protein
LFDPNKNNRVAGVFSKLKFTDHQGADRRPDRARQSQRTTPAFIPELFDLNANPGDIGPPLRAT